MSALTALLVDDEEDQMIFVRDLLKSGPLADCTVRWAASGAAALAALGDGGLDVALVDYRLGGENGLDVVRAARDAGNDIPIIVLTGHGGREADLAAMRAGADDFLDKLTLTPEGLERAIRYAVKGVQAQRALRRGEAQRAHLAALVQSAEDSIVGLSTDGIVQSWNAGAERLYGYTAQEIVGQSVERLVPDDQRSDYHHLLARVAGGEHVANHLAERIRKDGARIAVAITLAPVRGPSGEVTGISAVAHDVTAEQEARRALEDSEQRYRTMFEASPVGMAHADLSGRWIRCNSSLVEMLGYSEDELVRFTVTEITHPDDVIPTHRLLGELLAGARRRHDIEKRYRRKDETYVWARAHVSLYRDSTGRPRYFIAAIEDITTRKAVEEQLRGTLDRLEAIVSNLPVVLWTLDTTGVITFAEGLLLPRFGVKSSDLVGRSILELYAANADVCATARRAIAGEQVHVVVPVDDGRYETWYSPLRDRDGRLTGTIGIAIEITERLRLEEQFRQAQKMEAVGRLAGGVAHDFNNLLTAIIGYSELALEDLPPDAATRREFEEIHRAAQSAAALTRQLLAFSRRQMLQPEHIDLNAVVSRTQGLLRRLIGEDIALAIDLSPDLEHVHADPTQIEQILLNLAVNARDAMPHGGRLTLATANVRLDGAFTERHPGAATGPHVRLSVSDEGVGMDEATRKRLFEPFFTTKERGRGTGLGLATVYGIVKQSGGYIGVDSAPGQGSTFNVFLPAVPGVAETLLPPSDAPLSLSGTETILIVEDQAEVRIIARRTLTRYGYTVLDAAAPDDAVALLDATDVHIDLLFTDVVMPQRSGRALAQELTARRPGLKVIYTSGYADSAIVDQSVLAPGLAFLPKPFTARALLTKVREVLDAGQAPNV